MTGMASAILTLKTLFSHWHKHKIQLFTLCIGLASATALWTAVQALNTHARASYDRSAATVGSFNRAAFVSIDGQPFGAAAFAAIRRAGLEVTPIVEGRFGPSGQSVQLTGIDPLSYRNPVAGDFTPPEGVSTLDFLEPPGLLYANADTSVQLRKILGQVEGKTIPAIEVLDTIAPGSAIGDIAVVQALLEMDGKLSKLLLPVGDTTVGKNLPPPWWNRLQRQEPVTQVDLAGLTDSFHLNLTAFGLLCFLVGLFIVYSAIGLAIEDRLPVFRTLRVCGVALKQLLALMVLEMVVIAAVSGTIGILAGYVIASVLLPDVAASLRGLYGAQIGGVLTLDVTWWFGGLAISILGALASAFGAFLKVSRMSLLEARGSSAWILKQGKIIRIKASLALFFLSLTVFFYAFGSGLFSAFMVMAGILLGAAFLLPAILALLLSTGQRLSSAPVTRWFWSDSRQQLSGLSLALMALLLALGTNVGVSGMVEGFRNTFNAFLEERLSADLYVLAPSDKTATAISEWAKSQSDIIAVLPIWNANSETDGLPVAVTGFEDHPSYRDTWSLLARSETAWQDATNGDGILINEQLSYARDLVVGSALNLKAGSDTLSFPVVGIYADYGNPRAEVRLPNHLLIKHWPDGDRDRLSFHISGDVEAVTRRLGNRFDVPVNQMINQAALKNFSRGVFEKTFTISGALGTLTLGVAGIAMVTSLLTLSHSRVTGVAPLWAMGVERRVITRLELLKILMLASLTSLAAIPLGIAITWCLVEVINVEAFGWRLPLHVFPLQWVQLAALGLATAFIASIYPVIRLHRTPPAEISKVFAHEH